MFDIFAPAINLIDKMNDDILMILVGFLLIVSTLFMWLWFSNRRKYHNLKHAIPANIVKSYLDSIIQNSTALKSQLFRGGGQDIGNIPSVMSLQNLVGGEGVALNGAPSTALMEELNQKKAMIANLESQLSPLKNANRELDSKFGTSQTNLSSAEAKIKELEALLSKSGSSGAGGPELKAITKERDELRDRLKEFEIIADDLANLKRLQQENEQLKRSLSGQGKSMPEIKEEPKEDETDAFDPFENLGQSEPQAEETNALEEFLSEPLEEPAKEVFEEPVAEEVVEKVPESVPEKVAQAAPAPIEEAKSKSDKTPEDLLSEFEKMLG